MSSAISGSGALKCLLAALLLSQSAAVLGNPPSAHAAARLRGGSIASPAVRAQRDAFRSVVLSGISRCDERIDVSALHVYVDGADAASAGTAAANLAWEWFAGLADEEAHPELFYVSSSFCQPAIRTSGAAEAGEPPLAGGQVRARVTSIVPDYRKPTGQSCPAGEASSYKRAFESAVSKVVARARKQKSRALQAKYVHDWLLANVSYSSPGRLYGDVYEHAGATAYGALVGGRASCQGYALANKYILEDLGIPCDFVSNRFDGTGHSWNRIKIGGKWYHEDVTWDEPGKDRYFLKSDKWWIADAKAAGGGHHMSWKGARAGKSKSSSKYDKATWPCLVKARLGGAAVKLSPAKLAYNGCPREPAVIFWQNGEPAKLVKGRDYKVKRISGNGKYGKSKLRIVGIGHFRGTVLKSFRVSKRDIAGIYSEAAYKIGPVKYTGDPVKPVKGRKLSCKDGGKRRAYTMVDGRDFIVKYSNNRKTGTAKAVIKGKGKFKGAVTRTFEIRR